MIRTLIFMLFFTPCIAQTVNHLNLADFDNLQPNQLEVTRALRILFMDRSVGWNTDQALNCLSAYSYGDTSVTCRRDRQYIDGAWVDILRFQADHDAGTLPLYIDFSPSPETYDRFNFTFHFFYDTWDVMARKFTEGIHNGVIQTNDGPVSISDFDVISFQFSYLNVTDQDSINNWFTHLPGEYDDAYDLEREVAEHLDPLGIKFTYWTASLARTIGTQVATDFNNTMREWADVHGRPLFDFADIEAHDSEGYPCYDTTGQFPAICEEKTSETNGGHPSSAQGRIAVAKGFWLFHALVAGVEPPPPPPDPVEELASFLEYWLTTHSEPYDFYELATDILSR